MEEEGKYGGGGGPGKNSVREGTGQESLNGSLRRANKKLQVKGALQKARSRNSPCPRLFSLGVTRQR